MFGSIGITEIMLIAGIALIFLGPEKFPEFAKIMARTVRDIRGYVQDAQKDIAEELKPIKKELDKLSSVDPEAYLEKLADAADDENEYADIIPEPDISPTLAPPVIMEASNENMTMAVASLNRLSPSTRIVKRLGACMSLKIAITATGSVAETIAPSKRQTSKGTPATTEIV